MAQKLENLPLKIDYGHTETNVVLTINHPVTNITLTLEQTEAMITSLTGARDMFKKYLAAQRAGKPLNG